MDRQIHSARSDTFCMRLFYSSFGSATLWTQFLAQISNMHTLVYLGTAESF